MYEAQRTGREMLSIDCEAECKRIASFIRDEVFHRLRRKGVVVGLSGGIDSSVCAALAVKALGEDRVTAILMPETDSSSESLRLGKAVAEQLNLRYHVQDIAPVLHAVGCYRARDAAIQRIVPEYSEDWKCKLAISGGMEGRINHFRIVVQSPDGERIERRLPYEEYLQIVAATNYKQRIRKSIEYFFADARHFAVMGTPNRLEYELGFFVKNGDGAADIKPIAHLYKSQVYALADGLGIPEEIIKAPPSTDTYSMQQSQDEFFFGLPVVEMDIALWAHNHKWSESELASALSVPEELAGNIYLDIGRKKKASDYLHSGPRTLP